MENAKNEKPVDILLVEDDSFDAKMTEKILKRGHQLNFKLSVVKDGLDALAYLQRKAPHEKAARPDLILLDMGLPKMDGGEFLKQMKKDASLKDIPVVILTGQQLEGDPVKQFKLHEHAYINKWLQIDDLKTLIQAVSDFRSSPQ